MLELEQGTVAYVGFKVRDGLLFYKDKVVILHSSSIIPQILKLKPTRGLPLNFIG